MNASSAFLRRHKSRGKDKDMVITGMAHYESGDKQELYEDVYGKVTNTCHTEE